MKSSKASKDRSRLVIATHVLAAIVGKRPLTSSYDFDSQAQYEEYIRNAARGAVNYADVLLAELDKK